jgi:predicted dehydrogenase
MTRSASATFPIALIGAGAVGRMHAERCRRHDRVHLAAIADPTDAGRDFAESIGVPWFADHRALLQQPGLGGVIVATPNATHLAVGLDCIARGLPLLMEKPITDNVADGERLCAAAEAAGVPLMVGHQRRHNPIIRRAKAMLDGGLLGRPVSVNAMATWLKPDSYFDLAWHRMAGAGTVLINLIHDIDLLRHLLGEIEAVQAMTSNAVRGFEVEDSAAVLLRFANGALGTLSVSDTAVAPWNWDLAAGEAAHYPQQPVNSHFLSGTEASLTLPRLDVWRYRGARGWHEELTQEHTALHLGDPYFEQMRQFRAVAEGSETPRCSGRDGLRTLSATLAVHESARMQRPAILTK